MTSASLEKFNEAEKKKMQEDDDVSLSESGRSVIWQYFEKLKAKKIFREDKASKKNLKCCAGPAISLFGHLRSYHQKICKEAEDKREEAQRKQEKKNQTYKRFAITRSRTE